MQVWSATGRRKRATAQVRICSPGTGTIKVNQVDAEQYLQGAYANILKPFETLQLDATYDIFIRTEGGGLNWTIGCDSSWLCSCPLYDEPRIS